LWLLPLPAHGRGPLAEGAAVPDLRLQHADGSSFQLSSALDGKVALINFWATWCGPCMQELPALEALYKKTKDTPGLLLLAVNVDEGMRASSVAALWKRYGFQLPVALDASGRAGALFGLSMLPMSYVIGKDKKVRHSVAGARDWSSDQWARGLKAMAAGEL